MVQIDFTLFIQWLNFGVLVFILYLILFRPLMKFLDERNHKLKDDIETARKNREESDQLHTQYRDKLNDLRAESVKYVEDAKRKAKQERESILKQAHKEAERLIDNTRDEIQFEAEKAKQQLKQEISSLVIDCAAQILEREVKEPDHKKLIDSFLKEEVKGD